MSYNNTYPIDKNVPVPESNVGRGTSTITNTITMLRIGESFFVPKLTKQRKASLTSKQISNNVTNVRKKYPQRKFAVRTVKERGQSGARCWRVA